MHMDRMHICTWEGACIVWRAERGFPRGGWRRGGEGQLLVEVELIHRYVHVYMHMHMHVCAGTREGGRFW